MWIRRRPGTIALILMSIALVAAVGLPLALRRPMAVTPAAELREHVRRKPTAAIVFTSRSEAGEPPGPGARIRHPTANRCRFPGPLARAGSAC